MNLRIHVKEVKRGLNTHKKEGEYITASRAGNAPALRQQSVLIVPRLVSQRERICFVEGRAHAVHADASPRPRLQRHVTNGSVTKEAPRYGALEERELAPLTAGLLFHLVGALSLVDLNGRDPAEPPNGLPAKQNRGEKRSAN